MQDLRLLAGPDPDPHRSTELIMPEHLVEHREQECTGGGPVEGPGLGEQRIDPLGVVPLEGVTPGGRRAEHAVQVVAGILQVSSIHHAGDDHVAVVHQPLGHVSAAGRGGHRCHHPPETRRTVRPSTEPAVARQNPTNGGALASNWLGATGESCRDVVRQMPGMHE